MALGQDLGHLAPVCLRLAWAQDLGPECMALNMVHHLLSWDRADLHQCLDVVDLVQ